MARHARIMTGEQLRDMRIENGITQQQLAKWLDISPRMLSNYEHGRHPIPRAVALAALSAPLHMPSTTASRKGPRRRQIPGANDD